MVNPVFIFRGTLEECSNFCWKHYRVYEYAPIWTTDRSWWDDEDDQWVGGDGKHHACPWGVMPIDRAIYETADVHMVCGIWRVEFVSQPIKGMRSSDERARISFRLDTDTAARLGLNLDVAYAGGHGERTAKLADILAEFQGTVRVREPQPYNR